MALLGAYLATRVVDILGGGSAAPADVARLLEAQTGGPATQQAAALREELAAAIRVLFAAGAAMMAVATAIALRMREPIMLPVMLPVMLKEAKPPPARGTSA